MKILVTGAAGYIGSALARSLLMCGDEVVAVDNLMYRNGPALSGLLVHQNLTFYREDARDTGAIARLAKDCDVVIPLAALVGAPLCEKRPVEAVDINYKAVADLVKRLSSQQKILFPNTNSGYGATGGEAEVTEASPMRPLSIYGKTKCEAEKAVLDHPEAVVLRLATVFGASNRMRLDLLVNQFAAEVWTGLKRENALLSFAPHTRPLLTVFEPEFVRNFVHVMDVVRAFCHFLDEPRHIGVYNVGLPDANLTKLELAHRVCDTLRVSRERVVVGNGTDPDKRNYRVSNAKLLATGFRFLRTLEEGIIEVAQVVETHTPNQMKEMRNV